MSSPSDDAPTSTGSIYFLSKEQVDEESVRATDGDIASAVKLYKYYLLVASDQDQAIRWLKLAATAGDEISQFNLAKILYMNGDLKGALHWAEVLRANKYPGIDNLIDEINRNAK
ncbi:hypothetical protein BX592_1545 [Paraburkholderia rhizosphaerae]|uniref:Tetratricopeptide repeat protein n=2 Tax=Paraburkholderia rhizosphaerae TaxID=480658 RepID=A0A4R8KQ02_9BURK|nr:hypothetical protein BX592_1545 [Paraburkholderia rhizosphaerae]